MPSPKRRAGPRTSFVFVDPCEPTVHRVAAAPDVGAVHDVVVHERERVHELERGGRVDHGLVVERAARADECARAERGPQPLAARGHELAQRVERIGERVVDRDPTPALRGQQRVDARLDPVGDGIERLGERRSARRRWGHGSRGYAAVSAPCAPVVVRRRPVVRARRRWRSSCRDGVGAAAEFLSDDADRVPAAAGWLRTR